MFSHSFLFINDFSADPSNNGLQVSNANPNSKEIKKIAFAVDACQESIDKAIKEKADLLFVHHGLFWSSPVMITNKHYERVSALIKNDLALYACHIPLGPCPVCPVAARSGCRTGSLFPSP